MAQPSNNNNFQSSLNPNASPHLQGSARFRIEREIADTLQGRIYFGTDLVTNKACVIKEAWKQLVHSSRSRKGHRVPENFLHEREMIMMLSNCNDAHKGIVKGIDQWDDDHCYYYAMEYCNGELFDYISKNHTSREYRNFIDTESKKDQIPMKKANKWVISVAKMFKQICLATQWMHLKGFCHLDMSLENTMIDLDTLTVKIIDFGLARRFKNGDYRFNGRVGKLQYMCPEAYARQTYDARSADVYTLGIMLFMMLIGAPPYSMPQAQNAAFNYFINGRIADVLKHWKRLRLVTDDALDLLSKIIRYEKQRISIQDILNHPFITSLDVIDDQNDQKNDDNNNKITNNIKMNTLSPNVDNITADLSSMSIDDDNNNNTSKCASNNQQNQPNQANQPQSNQIDAMQQDNPNDIDDPNDINDDMHIASLDPSDEDQDDDVKNDHIMKKNNNSYQKPINNAFNNNNGYMYGELLLAQFGLSTYSLLFQQTGWGDPQYWHQLTVPVLKYEVGLTDIDSQSFIQQYSAYAKYKNQQQQQQT